MPKGVLVYARRRRHSLAHLCAEHYLHHSLHYSSQVGWDALPGWPRPSCHVQHPVGWVSMQ